MAAITAAAAWAGTAATAETLILAHGYTPSHTLVTEWIQPWMQCVTDGTGGEVDFNYFPSGQIVTIPSAVSAMESGLADVSVAAIGANSDRFPLNGVTMLPGMGDTALQMVRAYRIALDAEGPMRQEFIDSQLVPVSLNMTPVYQVMWRRDVRDTVAAIAGQLVRTQEGAMSLAARSIGAVPVEMPPADIYVALERGAIDGVLLAPLSVPPYHLNEVLGAISRNASFGSSASVLSISRTAFDRLTPDAQEQVLNCGQQIETSFAAFFDRQNDELLADFAAKGIDVFAFSDAELVKMQEMLSPVPVEFIARVSAMGKPAEETYNAYRALLPTVK